jgi:hypothetical protein
VQCGAAAPGGFVASSDDCCDRNDTEEIRAVAATIFSGQTELFGDAQTICPDVRSHDYNCNGLLEGDDVLYACETFPDCRTGWLVSPPPCGDTGDEGICTSSTMSGGPGVGQVTRCVSVGGPMFPSPRQCN